MLSNNTNKTPFDIHYLVLSNIYNDVDPQNLYGEVSFLPDFLNQSTKKYKNFLESHYTFLESASSLQSSTVTSLSDFLNDYKTKDFLLKGESFFSYYQLLKYYHSFIYYFILSASILENRLNQVESFFRRRLLSSHTSNDVATHLYKSDFANKKDIDTDRTTAYLNNSSFQPTPLLSVDLNNEDVSLLPIGDYIKQEYNYGLNNLLTGRIYANKNQGSISTFSLKLNISKIENANILNMILGSMPGLKQVELTTRYGSTNEARQLIKIEDLKDKSLVAFSFLEKPQEIKLSFVFSDFSSFENSIPYFLLSIKSINFSRLMIEPVSVYTDFISFPISDSLNYKISSFSLELQGLNTDKIIPYYSIESLPSIWNPINLNVVNAIANTTLNKILSTNMPYPISPNSSFSVLENKVLDTTLDSLSANSLDLENSFLLKNVHDLTSNNLVWIKEAGFYKAFVFTSSSDVTINFGPVFVFINNSRISGRYTFFKNQLYNVKIPEKYFYNIEKNDLSLFPKNDPLFPFNPKLLIEGSLLISEYPSNNFTVSSYYSKYIPYQLVHYLPDSEKSQFFSFLLDETEQSLYCVLPFNKTKDSFYLDSYILFCYYKTLADKQEKIKFRFDMSNTETLPVSLNSFTCRVI